MTHMYLGSPFLSGANTIEKPDFTQFPLWGIYFSASWCMPCRHFTPYLAHFYNTQREQNRPFEVVYVSQDQSQEEFNEYVTHMPWLSVPYHERFRIQLITALLKPTRIPTLCIFNSEGKHITSDGVQDLGKYGEKAYQHWLDGTV